MLLSRIPVLDKGYAALISSCNTTQTLRDLEQEFFAGKNTQALRELGVMTVVLKCPLFVQLNLSKFSFRIINVGDNSGSNEVDAFTPNVAQVGAKDRGTSSDIADDISRTTAALLINPRAYQSDGANHFISQILTPINVYTTIIVHGSLKEWIAFAYEQKNVPGPIYAYTMALQQIIDAEWKK